MKGSEVSTDMRTSGTKPRAEMGILAWENELIQHPGNLIHPGTFDFPVLVGRVPGACYETVVERPDELTLRNFADTARRLESEGVGFIVSTTGLSVIFQRALTEAVDIPVVTSSLLLVPFVSRVIGARKRIGIITASKRFFSAEHLAAAGIEGIELCVAAIDHTEEFRMLALQPAQLPTDRGLIRQARSVLDEMRRACPDLGAIVIEVTGLCGQAGALRRACGLPVFDIVEISCLMRNALTSNRWG